MVLWKNHFRSQDNEHLSFWNVTFHKLLWTLKLFDAYIVKSFKYLFIWLCQVFSCGMWDLFIVTWSGIKSRPPALGAWRLSHWAPRRVPINYCFHVCREHALRIINLLSSLGMWGSCHHCFYLGSCLVLLLHGFVATKICAFFFFNLFSAVLGLGCCTRTFSSCSKWGLLSGCSAQAPHCAGFSCCGAQALECVGFIGCSARG